MTLLKLRADRPREVVGIVLNSALYGAASPYGRSEIGTREELEATSLADAASFYKERWNPAAMTLVVVGDVDAAALQAKLDLGLGAWRPAGVKAPALPAVTAGKPPARLLVVDRKDAAQSDVRIGMIGLDRRDPRFFAFEVLRTTLGDGFTSRLTQRLREQLGITYGARAAMDWRRRPGPFVIGSAIATPATGQGIREVLKLVDDLARIDVPGDELEKSKQNMIRASPERFDTNASTAATLAELALHGLPDDWYRGYAESVRKVTASEVRAVAGAALPASKLVVALAGDLAKIGADLGQLGLGAPALYDAYGRPLAK
jgi:predicted Zn-dependent peptidase